ncbi:MAG TPA: exostosin family protein [Abditibacteriaceae bacterium]|jgi:hypothetical protein
MKVHLVTASSFYWNIDYLQEFKSIALQDRIGIHQLTEDPATADIILFIDLHQQPDDWWMGIVHRHPLVKAYPNKVFVYDERDNPWYVAPGVYVSLSSAKSDSKCQRSGCYFTLKNDLIEAASTQAVTPDLLFSFMGAMSHSVRRKVVNLKHARAVIEDTSHVSFFASIETDEQRAFMKRQKERYKEILLRSKFILCPRGMGTSSFRLFESMAVGRVPVIISDDWVAPQGPEWDSCSVRVAESQVENIPDILEAKENSFEELSSNARKVWHEWFAADVRFHQVIEACAALQSAGCSGPRSHPMMSSGAMNYGGRLLARRMKQQVFLLLSGKK